MEKAIRTSTVRIRIFFFVIRNAAELHGVANKQNFHVIPTAAVRISSFSVIRTAMNQKVYELLLLFNNSSILFDNQKIFSVLVCLITFFLNKHMHFLFLFLYPIYKLDVLQVSWYETNEFIRFLFLFVD